MARKKFNPKLDEVMPDTKKKIRYVDTLGGTGRKRRSDFKGGDKKDYHQNTTTLTLRLPVSAIQAMRASAEKEEMTVNAWLGPFLLTLVEVTPSIQGQASSEGLSTTEWLARQIAQMVQVEK